MIVRLGCAGGVVISNSEGSTSVRMVTDVCAVGETGDAGNVGDLFASVIPSPDFFCGARFGLL